MQQKTYKSARVEVIAFKKLQLKVNEVLNRYNLNTSQWILLGTLHEHLRGTRVTDLAHDMQVEVPFVTMLAQPLQREGLVGSASQSKDRRVRLLTLTKQGHERVQSIERELRGQLRDLLRGVSENELTTYFRVLETIITNSQRMAPANS
jgi:DNA-binding MarR family transcriptional regulator